MSPCWGVFTTISDAAEHAEIILLLNHDAENTITAIQGAGGDVLKLIGVGIQAGD